MSWFEVPNEIKQIINTVAPTIATALGGPLAGVAVRTISEALLGTVDAPVDVVTQAVKDATPDQLLELKKAEQDFIIKMRKLEISVEKLHQEDRHSARQREAKTNDQTPKYLAVCITIGFFSILAWMLIYGLPPAGGEALLLMLGSLGTAWIAIVNYYFGSSAGSKQKNEQLENLLNQRQQTNNNRGTNG